MIFRPVRPLSPCGPPTTNRPVGLTKMLVCSSISAGGNDRPDHLFDEIALGWFPGETSSLCWVETTTASTRTGRSCRRIPPSPGFCRPGADRAGCPSLRTRVSRMASLWAREMGRGISSGVSSQAKPNISPWSPGADAVVVRLPRPPRHLQRLVDAHGDVRGLLVNGGEHRAGVAVKAAGPHRRSRCPGSPRRAILGIST